ncbi:unnamed protein product [Caenorhabditis nigoni]
MAEAVEAAEIPEPVFTYFGVDGGATCSCAGGKGEKRFFVGSQRGVVREYGLESKRMEGNVYIDREERRIQSLKFHKDHIFVHVRAFAVVQLKEPENVDNPLETWDIIKTFEMDHIGFCNSIIFGSKLLYVSTDEQRYSTLCCTEIAGTENHTAKARILTAPDISPMCMIIGEESENEVLIGMEDGRLAIAYGDEKQGVFDYIVTQQLGKDPIFCLASSSEWVVAGCARPPIHLVNRTDLVVQKIDYVSHAAGCSTIAFSPNNRQIIGGFFDGSIRVFSRHKLTVLLALTNFHEATISSIQWLPEENDELVIAASSDETITLWKLK